MYQFLFVSLPIVQAYAYEQFFYQEPNFILSHKLVTMSFKIRNTPTEGQFGASQMQCTNQIISRVYIFIF